MKAKEKPLPFNRFLHAGALALRSTRFFSFCIGLLVIQAVWIACTGRYPMAFDENFHLGIIQIYAHHLSPFLKSQPPNANAYGAVARDPSYLYQYLMSFPYRLIKLFTHDQTIQVIVLRFINIALFTSGLPLYRRFLAKTGASRSVVNLAILIFVLLPITPLLAAQINYDNLFLPVVAASLLLTVRLIQDLKSQHKLHISVFISLAIVCLLGSLVKYAFLPIFLAIGLIVAWHMLRQLDWRTLSKSFVLPETGKLVGLSAILILSLVLFGQRYAINIVDYDTPLPDCSQVLTISDCQAYGPWARNYNDTLHKVHNSKSPLTFTSDWFYGMWLRTYFAVDGPYTNFQTHGPFFLPSVSAIVFGVSGLGLIIAYGRRVWQRYDGTVLWLGIVTSLVYTGFLWLDEYKDFVHTGQPVAINGRYLLPVLLPPMVVITLAFTEALHSRPRVKTGLAALLVLCTIWGGGVFTYILRSNDNWYWPSQPVRTANHVVQHIFGPITPGNSDKNAFLK
jgi:hypothetical protein